MNKTPEPTPEELILAMLRDVLARQAEQMGLKAEKDEPPKALPLTVRPPEVVPPAPPPAAVETPPPPPAPLPKPAVEISVPLPSQAPPPKVEPPLEIPKFTPALRQEPPPAPPKKTPAAELFAPIRSVEDTQPTARVKSEPAISEDAGEPLSHREQQFKVEFDELAARPFSPSTFSQILRVFVITLFALVAFLNVPLVQGSAIIRTLTDPKPVALSNGTLIREEGGPAVYMIENGRRRLISSSEAFQHYGFRWGDVREVPRDFLRSIPEGSAIHVLVKCTDLPEIYLLEGLEKRWVRDLGALEALGYDVNRDLRWVSCARLRSMFDGLPLP